MRTLTNPQSGKEGRSVSYKSRYGQVSRQHVKPRNPRTAAQLRIRANLGRVAGRWRGLTEEQRVGWSRAARDTHTRRRLGQATHLTGCQLFIKINSARAAVGLELLLNPPEVPKFEDNPVSALVIANEAGEVSLKLKLARTPAAPVIVRGIAPRSPGVSYAWNFVTLGLLPPPVRGFSDITQLYVDRFGVPPAGMKIFIRTRQQINGWEDAPAQVSAIVPKT